MEFAKFEAIAKISETSWPKSLNVKGFEKKKKRIRLTVDTFKNVEITVHFKVFSGIIWTIEVVVG